ncbi:MAG TPA: sugar phosphate isomerase/epimerase family protein [Lacipirellulaceae bacterium]|nr:sugar phosphate isomerase/epimerase family protein [Lacipirellulaceae bacterium]
MSVFVSSHALPGRTVPDVVALAASAGVRHIELTAGLTRADTMLDEILSARAEGVEFLTHNYFPPPPQSFVLNVASDDADTKKASMSMAREAMSIAAAVGAPFHSMHAGFAVSLTPDMLGKPEMQAAAFAEAKFDRAKAYRRMVETAVLLADEAKDLGIDLLFENNVVTAGFMNRVGRDPLLMTSPDEAMQFVRDVARTNVGLLVDVGHANVSAAALGFDRRRFLDDAAPFVRALHLSGNDGTRDSNKPFGPDDWFADQLKDFCSVPIVVEVYGLDVDGLRRQVEIVQSLTQ